MGELLFVGLGLCDEQDLTLRAVEALKGVPEVILERYTSWWDEAKVARLSQRIGRPIRELSREEVEEERPILGALAKHSQVALLVIGEPFAATTHVALRLAVEHAGHSWRLLHNASILTAAASLSGLSHYKFGRTVSLPRPSPGFRPTSPYEWLASNRRAGLHTLVLLDLDPRGGSFLTGAEALGILQELEDERHGNVLRGDEDVMVVARAGSADERVYAGRPRDLVRTDLGPPLHCLIIPAPDLHFLEREAVDAWKGRTPAPHR